MFFETSPQRLSEFQALCREHYGLELSERETGERLSALVGLLAVCHRQTARQRVKGRDSNPAPVKPHKNTNE